MMKPRAWIWELEHQIESVKSLNAFYRNVHLDMSNLEEAEVNVDDEELILSQHEDAVENTLSVITHMIDIRTIHAQVTELE